VIESTKKILPEYTYSTHNFVTIALVAILLEFRR